MIQLGIHLKVITFLQTSLPFLLQLSVLTMVLNRSSLKVTGSIKGLTNKQYSLDEYFLTAGKTSVILDDFADHFNIQPHQEVTEHYQLTGSKM